MVGVRDDVLDTIGRPWMTLGIVSLNHQISITSIGQAIDDLET